MTNILPEEDQPFHEQRELEYDHAGRRLTRIFMLLFLALLVNTCSYFFGASDTLDKDDRTSGNYGGSVSYTELPIYFYAAQTMPVSLDGVDYMWEYGFNPRYHEMQEIQMKVVESSIRPERLGQLFFNPERFSFKPDTLYYALLDIRGNYWSFPFREKHTFEVHYAETVGEELQPQDLEESDDWRKKIIAYSLASHLQFTALALFFGMLSYSAPIRERTDSLVFRKSKRAVAFTLLMALVYVLCTAYKTYCDAPYLSNEWLIWFVIANGMSIFLLYKCYQLLRDSKDFVRISASEFEYRDNQTHRTFGHKSISKVEAVGFIDDEGRYTYSGQITFDANGETILIPLNKMNLGGCDLEILHSLKKLTGESEAKA